MKFFVFRITDTCDKGCATCCCARARKNVLPGPFREKLHGIDVYCRATGCRPLIFLTGGEPFLYKTIGEDGHPLTVPDLVGMIRERLGQASIVVKTAGWTEHRVLDRRFEQLQERLAGGAGEVRLGFNLFQAQGARAEDRLRHMLALLLAFQATARVETIYDKANFRDTFAVIERVLQEFDVPRGASLAPPDPVVPYRHVIPVRRDPVHAFVQAPDGHRVVLDTMPAYSGVGRVESDRCFEVEYTGLCERIQNGADHVMYDADLSVFHCNDAFADHSVPAFPPHLFGSIDEEFRFLERTFADLERHLAERRLVFTGRLEQCTYCTRFFHS